MASRNALRVGEAHTRSPTHKSKGERHRQRGKGTAKGVGSGNTFLCQQIVLMSCSVVSSLATIPPSTGGRNPSKDSYHTLAHTDTFTQFVTGKDEPLFYAIHTHTVTQKTLIKG